jgi:acyl-CoA synthetase (NDP forming)
MRAKVSDAGVLVVDTLEELVDVSHLLLRCPVLPSGGTAVLTESGAFKAITLDLCERLKLRLPPLSEQTASALRAALPEFIEPSNPLDVTAQGLVDPDLYRRTLPPLLAESAFGSILLTIILTDERTQTLKLPPILDALSALDLTKPIIFIGLDEGAWINPDYIARLRELGIPFFPTPERAFRAVARLSAICRMPSTLDEPPSMTVSQVPPRALTEYESKNILRSVGLPVPAGELALSVRDAKLIAEQIGYPVVLKAQSASLPHKTDAGGVVLSLRNQEELEHGWEQLHINLQHSYPHVQLDGVLVEKMAERGTEFIVGARNDREWGPTVLVGLGGVFAEALNDVRLLVPRLSTEQVICELHRLKGASLLHAFRGAPAPDVLAIADVVKKLGDFALAHPEISDIDLNPVVAHTNGALILDALVVGRK